MKDKNILITGGASGIGLATAQRCMQEGANVALADLAGAEGPALAAELDGKTGGRCLFLALDVSSTEQVNRMIAATIKELGALDGVFNNAGIVGLGPADSYPDGEFLRVVDINPTGVFRVASASLHQMHSRGSGRVVSCASILGVVGQSLTAAHSAAKGGLINLTRTLALEAVAKGVRVNAVASSCIGAPLLAVHR